MSVKKDDIVTIEGSKYFVLLTFVDEGINYAFANQITDDEEDVTDIYYLFKEVNNQLERITDEKVVAKYSQYIAQKLQETLESIE